MNSESMQSRHLVTTSNKPCDLHTQHDKPASSIKTTSQNVNTTRPLAHASASASNNKSAESQQKNTLNHVSRQDESSQQPKFAIAPSQASMASWHRAASRSQIQPSTSDQHSCSNQSTQAIEKKTQFSEKAIHTHMPGYSKSHLIDLPPLLK
ncbi:hypothetical protein O181_115171 [Austropuccinia psidii MF-1]|uniref:Uncharacterized protein n=1 Tax=Austropuccinia psidii MF-1 TaxID=1389203 RepID=A0A9Q3K8A9_9BASI|nr:hypothetical protein [Austropuccinia psidii MF-1]